MVFFANILNRTIFLSLWGGTNWIINIVNIYIHTFQTIRTKLLIVFFVLLRADCNDLNLFYTTFILMRWCKILNRISEWTVLLFEFSQKVHTTLFGNHVFSMINYLFLLETLLVPLARPKCTIFAVTRHNRRKDPPWYNN